MKRILITGGAGFIGSTFTKHMLARYPSYDFTIYDALTYAGTLDNLPPRWRERHNIRFVRGDINDRALLERVVHDHDVVVHFAAESHVRSSQDMMSTFMEANVAGTHALCEAMFKAPHLERFIHISSAEVYGNPETPTMDESHPLMPSTPYAGTKAAADRLVYSYYRSFGLPAIIVRPFNNYGPFQHPEKAIPRFITNVIQGLPITLQNGGEQTRDWLFVDDHVEALERLVEGDIHALAGEAFNFGTGHDVSVKEVATLICDMLGKPDHPFVNKETGFVEVKRYAASTAKAERLLGWQPRVSFEEGLERTIRWYTENSVWWRRFMSRVDFTKEQQRQVI